MDRIMSARLNEKVIRHIGMLADKLGTSKKAVIENAIECYLEKIESEEGSDVLSETCGVWQREETAAETVATIKGKMRTSQERYRR